MNINNECQWGHAEFHRMPSFNRILNVWEQTDLRRSKFHWVPLYFGVFLCGFASISLSLTLFPQLSLPLYIYMFRICRNISIKPHISLASGDLVAGRVPIWSIEYDLLTATDGDPWAISTGLCHVHISWTIPYAPRMEYSQTFALKITEFCR